MNSLGSAYKLAREGSKYNGSHKWKSVLFDRKVVGDKLTYYSPVT